MFHLGNLEQFVLLTLLNIENNIFERWIDKTPLVKIKFLYEKIYVKGYNGDFISNDTINECRKNKGANN
ncbi:hypothetical protein CON07_05280 [Bacillus sp. AFS094611]|nr:hypothetical protein CON07_05280 [Bacillus sp. AFS094611]